jgi:hypothetical protein
MEMRGQSATAAKHERRQRREVPIDLIDLALESGHLVWMDPEFTVRRIAAWARDIRTEIE